MKASRRRHRARRRRATRDDYFAVPDEQIKRIRSVLTVVAAKIVSDAGVVK